MYYDSMSVHELVRLISDNMADVLTNNQHGPPVYEADVESAIRKAVIREARVGTIEFNSAFEDGIGVVLGDDLDGYYYLIPREVS